MRSDEDWWSICQWSAYSYSFFFFKCNTIDFNGQLIKLIVLLIS